ncbi:hypothetical protein [Haloarcula rubripromontorii]|uniref:DUF8106 domain-containing protein n=1 Tax=Haloarcula rubripromontorii TaxID=1705562 RepID=A0A847TLZ1_9EURY|nr:hypothetical protein [Haloarcula rubripromontorii]NLV07022.1 hypothetical protein [Haloarcula rubripromontorii]
MSPTDSRAEHSVPAKATLFCPDCGHQSRYDGDWIVVERAAGTHYRCPECHAQIATRPSHTDCGASRFFDTYWQAWNHGIRAWNGLLQRLLSP